LIQAPPHLPPTHLSVPMATAAGRSLRSARSAMGRAKISAVLGVFLAALGSFFQQGCGEKSLDEQFDKVLDKTYKLLKPYVSKSDGLDGMRKNDKKSFGMLDSDDKKKKKIEYLREENNKFEGHSDEEKRVRVKVVMARIKNAFGGGKAALGIGVGGNGAAEGALRAPASSHTGYQGRSSSQTWAAPQVIPAGLCFLLLLALVGLGMVAYGFGAKVGAARATRRHEASKALAPAQGQQTQLAEVQ